MLWESEEQLMTFPGLNCGYCNYGGWTFKVLCIYGLSLLFLVPFTVVEGLVRPF